MKYILLSLNILLLLSCSKNSSVNNKVWESLYLNTEIYQLKLKGDSIYYIDDHLVNHTAIKSEFEPINLKGDTLFINDSIPFILSPKPKLEGINLPNIPILNELKHTPNISISITYNQNYGYGNVYFGVTQVQLSDIYDNADPSKGIHIFMDKNLPMHFFDSVRLNISQFGTFRVNIVSSQGINTTRFHFPFLEELSKPPLDIFNDTPLPPQNRFSSICKMLNDSLCVFVELNENINYSEIVSQLSSNTKTAFVFLYQPEFTVQQTFNPYFKLVNKIQLLRNGFALKNYETEFINLNPEKKKLIKRKYPIRFLLVNKQLVDECRQ